MHLNSDAAGEVPRGQASKIDTDHTHSFRYGQKAAIEMCCLLRNRGEIVE